MKNEDTQKTVKNNGLYIMKDRALYLMFSSLRPIKKQNKPRDAA